MPKIGMPVSFTSVTASSIVPSPPKLIIQSIEASKSEETLNGISEATVCWGKSAWSNN